jgi:flagellin-like hook-associated protein FlgL
VYLVTRLNDIEAKLDAIMEAILTEEETEMASITDVRNSVDAQTTVIAGVATLLDGLHTQLADVKAQLASAGADTSGLDAVMTSIQGNTDALSAAVARNTDAQDEIHAAGT